MYFKNLAEPATSIPSYFIDNVVGLLAKSAERPAIDPRRFLGVKNLVLGWRRMSGELRMAALDINHYIMSQQVPYLKNLVQYELVIAVPTSEGLSELSKRYADKVCELLVTPLSGVITIASPEFEAPIALTPGAVWRVNNRVPASIDASADAVALCTLMLDFDLKHYLMDWDLQGAFPRQPEERAVPTATTAKATY